QQSLGTVELVFNDGGYRVGDIIDGGTRIGGRNLNGRRGDFRILGDWHAWNGQNTCQTDGQRNNPCKNRAINEKLWHKRLSVIGPVHRQRETAGGLVRRRLLRHPARWHGPRPGRLLIGASRAWLVPAPPDGLSESLPP